MPSRDKVEYEKVRDEEVYVLQEHAELNNNSLTFLIENPENSDSTIMISITSVIADGAISRVYENVEYTGGTAIDARNVVIGSEREFDGTTLKNVTESGAGFGTAEEEIPLGGNFPAERDLGQGRIFARLLPGNNVLIEIERDNANEMSIRMRLLRIST